MPILLVADEAPLNINHLDNRIEDKGFEICMGWQAYHNNCTARSHIARCLLEWRLRGSD